MSKRLDDETFIIDHRLLTDLEKLSGKLGLADDRLKRSDSQFLVIGNGNGDRGVGRLFLHDDVTATAAHLAESL